MGSWVRRIIKGILVRRGRPLKRRHDGSEDQPDQDAGNDGRASEQQVTPPIAVQMLDLSGRAAISAGLDAHLFAVPDTGPVFFLVGLFHG